MILPRANQSDVIALQLGPGKCFGEMEFFHEKKHLASIRASEAGPVEVLAIGYDQLNRIAEPVRGYARSAASDGRQA